MRSVLEWKEDYSKLSDAPQMLYFDNHFPARVIESPSVQAPDQKWYYSSGTSNILSKIIRNTFDDDSHYIAFPYDHLFDKIGDVVFKLSQIV